VANHTCGVDPMFLMTGSPRLLSFLITEEFRDIKPLTPIFDHVGCIPVRQSRCDPGAVRLALRRLSEGRVVCIFPEGGLSNAGQPRHRRCWKAGVALIALRSGVPVYPALIVGGPNQRPMRPAWLKPSRVRVIFGPALDLSAYLGRPIRRPL